MKLWTKLFDGYGYANLNLDSNSFYSKWIWTKSIVLKFLPNISRNFLTGKLLLPIFWMNKKSKIWIIIEDGGTGMNYNLNELGSTNMKNSTIVIQSRSEKDYKSSKLR